jgi:hypothetical protein
MTRSIIYIMQFKGDLYSWLTKESIFDFYLSYSLRYLIFYLWETSLQTIIRFLSKVYDNVSSSKEAFSEWPDPTSDWDVAII